MASLSRAGSEVGTTQGQEPSGRAKMTILIFFGGLVAGFLIGWISLALLTLASRKNQEEKSFYDELMGSHPEGG